MNSLVTSLWLRVTCIEMESPPCRENENMNKNENVSERETYRHH